MIHVVHVVTRTNIGGPSVILDSLLADTSTEVRYTIVRGETDLTEGDYFAESGNDARFITVEGLGRSISPLADLRAFFRLITTLRLLSPDVVHTHMAKAGVVGRLAAWIARVPVRVHTYHGHLLYGYFSPLKTRLVVFIERMLKLITTHAVVVGSAVRTDLIAARIVSEQRSEMIPPGIATPAHDVVPDRCGVHAGKVLVGFVGRLVPIKRPDRFIDAAKSIASNHPNVEFVVVGDGPLGAETRVRAASVSAIRFAGWRRDIAPVLAGLDIVVLCSDNEGIPLSLIEASACGTPIAATNVGSVSDVVIDGTNGLLVQPTVDALAEGVSRLLADEQLRVRLGAEGKRVASERFSITAAQERHRAMYRKLVSGR
ncbi:MAG: glycosyltransferase family 4 protein [Ilumatobacteraceae bacterium]